MFRPPPNGSTSNSPIDLYETRQFYAFAALPRFPGENQDGNKLDTIQLFSNMDLKLYGRSHRISPSC